MLAGAWVIVGLIVWVLICRSLISWHTDRTRRSVVSEARLSAVSNQYRN